MEVWATVRFNSRMTIISSKSSICADSWSCVANPISLNSCILFLLESIMPAPELAPKEIERRMSYGLRNALRTPAKRHETSKAKGKESQSK